MRPEQFLKRVLPSEGYYCLAKPHECGYFLHRVTDTPEDAAKAALETDQAHFDAYFCVGSLKQRRIYDPAKNNGNGGYRYRTKANIHSLRSVFFEVDVVREGEAPDATKYETRSDALDAVKVFAAALGWGGPIVVSSGGGYHFYWPLDENVPAGEFQQFIEHLKTAARHFGLRLDHSALDIARVLRVPGTHNYKNPAKPAPVTIVRWTDTVWKFGKMFDALKELLERESIAVHDKPLREELPAYLNLGVSNIDDDYDPLDFRLIATKCGAIREVIEQPNDVGYSQWYHALQVIRHCKNGDTLVHKVSSLADSYTREETDKMLRTLEEKYIPPALCRTFERDTDACKACPFYGKIRSPAALGRPGEAKREVINQQLQSQITTMPPPPWPFKRVKGTGVVMIKKDQAGEPYDEVIYNYDLLPLRRVFSEREQREVTIWQTATPADGDVELEIPSSSLYDKRAFSGVLADAGVYAKLQHVDALRQYMIAYAQCVQQQFQREFQYSRLGWRDDHSKFVLGSELITPNGVSPCAIDNRGRVMGSAKAKGSLEEWKKILTFVSGDAFAGHQFAIGAGFGSVLLTFTAQMGGIINMIGRSGEGKSTVQKIINSIWGHPTELMLPAEARSSTYNAKISFINMMNNLPICAEEITNTSAEDLGSLAYAVTQGTEKWRADIRGDVRKSLGGWCTLMISSSNASLYDKLLGTTGAVAKALRVFEYKLHHVRGIPKHEFQQGVDLPLLDNYGLAGRLVIKYIIDNLDAVRERLNEETITVDAAMGLQPEERIWSVVVSCALTGLWISQRLGLHDFNIEAVRLFAYDQVRKMRRSIDSITPPPQEILTQYLSENLRSMVVLEESTIGKSTDMLVVHKPSSGLNIRYELTAGQIFISALHFRRWCLDQAYEPNEVMTGLEDEGILKARVTKRTLSKGTDLAGGQTRCLMIDTDAVAFAGGVRQVKQAVGLSNASKVNP